MNGTRLASCIALTIGLLVTAPAGATESEAECVGPTSATKVYVTVEKIRSNDGLIAVTLYPDKMSRFLVKRGALFVRRVAARAPTTQFCLFAPEPGTYGIAIYHDANANYHIDRAGALGLPTEGFGFSNNASTLFGLPNFNSVRIKLHHDMHTAIRLRYLRGDEAQKAQP